MKALFLILLFVLVGCYGPETAPDGETGGSAPIPAVDASADPQGGSDAGKADDAAPPDCHAPHYGGAVDPCCERLIDCAKLDYPDVGMPWCYEPTGCDVPPPPMKGCIHLPELSLYCCDTWLVP